MASAIIVPGQVVGIFGSAVHVVVVAPCPVVGVFKGVVYTIAVGVAAHLIFLATTVLTLLIAV